MNHLKSKEYGSQASNDRKRKRQAARIKEIYEKHITAGDEYIAVVGDFNDAPESDPLDPLVSSTLKDISAFSGFVNGGRPGHARELRGLIKI